MVMITRNGKIKRTALSDYKNVRKNGLIAIGLDEGDEIAAVRLTNGSNRLFVATRNGMAIRIDESDVRPMSRSARCQGDHLAKRAMPWYLWQEREGASLLTVTENGFGKRPPCQNTVCSPAAVWDLPTTRWTRNTVQSAALRS